MCFGSVDNGFLRIHVKSIDYIARMRIELQSNTREFVEVIPKWNITQINDYLFYDNLR